MKRIARPLLLFVCSFAVGVCIAPVFKIEKEPVSEPSQKPVPQHRNKYGESVRRVA